MTEHTRLSRMSGGSPAETSFSGAQSGSKRSERDHDALDLSRTESVTGLRKRQLADVRVRTLWPQRQPHERVSALLPIEVAARGDDVFELVS